jgi:hypothetical protein
MADEVDDGFGRRAELQRAGRCHAQRTMRPQPGRRTTGQARRAVGDGGSAVCSGGGALAVAPASRLNVAGVPLAEPDHRAREWRLDFGGSPLG